MIRLPHSTATLDKLARAATGRKHTPEAKAKIAAARTGRKHTPETIEKIREARRARRTETLEDCVRRNRAEDTAESRARIKQWKQDAFIASYELKDLTLLRDIVRSAGHWSRRTIHHPAVSDGWYQGRSMWGSPRNLEERVRLGLIKGFIRTNRKRARRARLKEAG